MKVQNRNAVKISIYIGSQLHRDIQLLADFDNTSITNFVCSVLKDYIERNIDNVTFLRKQDQERTERKAALKCKTCSFRKNAPAVCHNCNECIYRRAHEHNQR